MKFGKTEKRCISQWRSLLLRKHHKIEVSVRVTNVRSGFTTFIHNFLLLRDPKRNHQASSCQTNPNVILV